MSPSHSLPGRDASVIPHDYHVHTDFSCDCQTSMADMCRSAVERGVCEVGFTEHLDLVPEDSCYAFFQVDAWWEELERCRETYEGVLTLRAGIEVGEPHRFAETIAPLLDRFPWDYALGAVHWVGPALIWDKAYYSREPDDAYRAYFGETHKAVLSGSMDVLAHMDIVKRYGVEMYGPYDPRRYEPEIRQVLRACALADMALEVNTSALRRPIDELSPEATVLAWFREEGGRWVSLGSDAHLPEHVAFGFERAMAAVRAAGFDHLVRFERRKRTPIPLPPMARDP